jgi:hypothetical protein
LVRYSLEYDEMGGHVARMGAKRNEYKLLVGTREGKRPLGRPDVGGWTILKWILER